MAFFNRNLRLAHLYGCYGPPDKFEMIMNPLPIVDLTEKQSQNLYNIPLNFYQANVARNAVRSTSDSTTTTSDINRLNIINTNDGGINNDNMSQRLLWRFAMVCFFVHMLKTYERWRGGRKGRREGKKRKRRGTI